MRCASIVNRIDVPQDWMKGPFAPEVGTDRFHTITSSASDGEPRGERSELLGGLETDRERELARRLNREIAGLGAVKYCRGVNSGIIGLERRRSARLLASVR